MIPAEEEVLSAAIITNGECLTGVTLTGRDFSTMAGGLLFDLIKSIAESGRPADLIAITKAIKEMPADEKRGYPSVPVMNALFAKGASGAAVPFHAEVVAEEAARRRLIAAGQWLVQYGTEGVDVDTLADKALEAVQGAVAGVSASVDSIGVTLADTINSFGSQSPIRQLPGAASTISFRAGGRAASTLLVPGPQWAKPLLGCRQHSSSRLWVQWLSFHWKCPRLSCKNA